MAFFNRGFDDGSLQITWYNASGKRCVYDVRDGRQEDVKIFIKKSVVGMGSGSQDLADALLIILKTNSSVTGSKDSKGFLAKEVSGQAVGFGGGKLFLMVRIFSVK